MRVNARKVTIPKPLEKHVSASIVEFFALVHRIELHRRNTGAMKGKSAKGKSWYVRFSTPGQSDLWGIHAKTGRHIEIEVKREGEEPSDTQRAWLASCREKGCIAFWAHSVEMADREYQRQRDFPLTPEFERARVSSEF